MGLDWAVPGVGCTSMSASDYRVIVGLEVHVQLATRTKMFSAATCIFGRPPNTQVDPPSLGLPGSLPVINRQAVDLAVTAALALGCDIHPFSVFDRKHYFYPDLPKNYQISQYDRPYCTGGGLTIDDEDGSTCFIPLTRIHMEEDAGKLIHQDQGRFSEVDLNRAGTPLIEIVSEPAIASPYQAYAFLVELKRVLKYCQVSDCEMQEGSLRCDANVSIRPAGQSGLGTKVEIKNLNSFRAVEAALRYEVQNQVALHRAGRYDEVVQETKLWDPDARVTRSMRGKEGDADYRYFPDPDLPPLCLSDGHIAGLRDALPELPRTRQERLMASHGLNPAVAAELTAERPVAEYFEALLAAGAPARAAANWTREEALRLAGARGLPMAEAAPVATMAALIALVEEGQVARVVAKGACDDLFAGTEEPRAFFAARGMLQERNDDRLAEWIEAAIAAHPAAVVDFAAGQHKAIGRLIGAVMKASGGSADPKAVQEALRRRLADCQG